MGGFVIFSCGGPLIWKCKVHHRAAGSTAVAEYYTLSHAVEASQGLRNILIDMGIYDYKPIEIHQDNEACILRATNEAKKSSTKFVELRYQLTCDAVKFNEVSIKKCPTKEMIADVFTKPLPKDQFEFLKTALRGEQAMYDQACDERKDRELMTAINGHAKIARQLQCAKYRTR